MACEILSKMPDAPVDQYTADASLTVEYCAASAGRTFIIDEILPVAACLQFLHDLNGNISDLITWREDARPPVALSTGRCTASHLATTEYYAFVSGFHGDAEAGYAKTTHLAYKPGKYAQGHPAVSAGETRPAPNLLGAE